VRSGFAAAVTVDRLQDQTRRGPFTPGARDMKEFETSPEPLRRPLHGSGGQPLPTFGAAARQDPTTANCRLACPEAVAPLANENARLIGAFQL
jgi:hypothetical protein